MEFNSITIRPNIVIIFKSMLYDIFRRDFQKKYFVNNVCCARNKNDNSDNNDNSSNNNEDDNSNCKNDSHKYNDNDDGNNNNENNANYDDK